MARSQQARDLAQRVRQQIFDDPQSHNQMYYARQTACGTVCCVAGWTAQFSLPDFRLDLNSEGFAETMVSADGSTLVDIDSWAKTALEIDEHTASVLFGTRIERAQVLEFLDALATDDETEIERLINEADW